MNIHSKDNFLKYLKTLTDFLSPFFDFNNYIYYYKILLSNFIRVLSITSEFLKSIILLLPDGFSDIRYLFKLFLLIIFYSKCLLTLNTVIPCPSFLINLSKAFFDLFLNMYSEILVLVNCVYNLITESMDRSKLVNASINNLTSELDSFREFNQKQFSEILAENRELKNMQLSYQKEIADIHTNNIINKEIILQLTHENSNLNHSLKATQYKTLLENSQNFLTILGNSAFIAIQLSNLYYSVNGGSASSTNADIAEILSTLRSMQNTFNLFNIRTTTNSRAAESAQTGTLSGGLTGSSIPFDENFNS